MKNTQYTAMVACLVALGTFGLAFPSFSNSTAPTSQKKGGGGGQKSGGGTQRSNNSGNSGGQAHARRETVRTQTYVPRNNPPQPQRQQPTRQPQRQPAQQPQRQSTPPDQGMRTRTTAPLQGHSGPATRRITVTPTPQVRNQRTFTKTAQGRHYDNGLNLRKGVTVTASWERRYFPKGHVLYFPFYVNGYQRGRCYQSPFGFYFGVCLPWISISMCSGLSSLCP